MSLQAQANNGARLFQTLASNSAAFGELLDYWNGQLEENVVKRNELAVLALIKPELVPLAQVQVGRCQMLQELIDHANTFK